MDIKDPNYTMLMMPTYGTLDNLEGLGTHRRYKGAGGSWRPNDSTIVRSLGITSITEIKLTTKKICAILLFQLREIGLKIIGPTGVMPTS